MKTKTILFSQGSQTHRVVLSITDETPYWRFGVLEYQGKQIPAAIQASLWSTMDGEGVHNCYMIWGMVPKNMNNQPTAVLYRVDSTGRLTL